MSMNKVLKYIAEEVILTIRREINDSAQNEVFFIGKMDENNLVNEIKAVARGNDFAVPVISTYGTDVKAVIHNHPSGILTPSDNDLYIAATLEKSGIVSYIINNDVTDIYAIYEPMREYEIRPLDLDEMVQYLKVSGIVARKLPDFEFRPQQIDMLKHISAAFNQNEIKIIEAGTGVGKSIAYLIPAIHWSVMNKERCVISTNTINLQEQLLKKDIPFLRSVLKFDFKVTLVKGRNNYLCLRKLHKLEKEPELLTEPMENDEIDTIISWSKVTKDGSKSDLNFVPRISIWEKVSSESDTCLRTKCKYHKKCFVNIARKEANDANILIVNHYLLFADLAMREMGSDLGILPSYRRIIFDEAHHLEDVATSNFGSAFTKLGMLRLIRSLYRLDQNRRDKGLLVHLKFELTRAHMKTNVGKYYDLVEIINTEIIPNTLDIYDAIKKSMDALYDYLSSRENNELGEIKSRIRVELTSDHDWTHVILVIFQNLIKQITTYINEVRKSFEKLKATSKSLQEAIFDVRVALNRLSAMTTLMEKILFQEDPDQVRWIELNTYSYDKIVRFKVSPLDISYRMRDLIYEIYPTIIMTSATLGVFNTADADEFDYFKKRIGLGLIDESRVNGIKLSSGFDYEEQVLLGIPTDIPAPGDRGFSERITEVILDSISISKGKAFVLFTSYGLLNLIYSKTEGLISQAGYQVLKQGQENRHQLIEKFKSKNSSVLFGTDSFWEGVDVKGDALELVIITKLPFRVPTEPIIEARIEQIQRAGGDPFLEYSMPQAIIKLKQGFGRLIRSRTDRGTILILDKRIIHKYYGKFFLSSLPECKLVKGTVRDVLISMTNFYRP